MIINYVIGENKTREKTKSMVVGEKVESDHHPIIVNIEEEEERRGEQEQKRKRREGGIGQKGGKNFEKG